LEEDVMRSLGLLALRMSAGLLFAAHGFAKLFGGKGRTVPPLAERYLGQGFVNAMERGGPANFAAGLTRMGVPAPRQMALVVGLTEFAGGLCLLAGFATRLTAAALAINMVFAIRLAHWKQGLIGAASGYMYALSMLGGMLAIAGNGAGVLSLDHRVAGWLARPRRTAVPVDPPGVTVA
jgi:putative oxidoreductase